MRKSRYPWSGVFVLIIAVGACGIQPRPGKGRGSGTSDLPGPEIAISEKEAPDDGFFELSGFDWTIREAKPQASANPTSHWALGSPVPFRGLLAEDRLVITEPLAWPDDPDSILMIQIRGDAAGDWAARCVRADGSVDGDESRAGNGAAPHRIEWDPESQSGLIPLHEVFGGRGQLRDPATVCTLLVRLDSRREGGTTELTLRVLGGLPAPEPVERKDHGWNVGGLLREEVWKNEGFRSLMLRIAAPSTLSVLSRLVAAGAPDSPEFRYSVANGAVLQARVILDSRISEWRPLPLEVRWTPGAVMRIEYRLAPAPGVSVCTPIFRLRVGPARISFPLRVASRQFAGKVSWEAVVSEDLPEISRAPARQSRKAELQRADDLLGLPSGSSPFDCQGWFS